MKFDLPEDGKGKDGLISTVEEVLKYSVNTWDQGFLDKLYASTNAVGVVAELILAVLNTNVSYLPHNMKDLFLTISAPCFPSVSGSFSD